MKKILLSLKVLAVWVLIIVVSLEIFLWLYDPFHFHVQGRKIRLFPHQTTTVHHKYEAIRQEPLITTNNLGFQGRDYEKGADQFRIFAVGGSTTACDLIATPYTWPVALDSLVLQKHPQTWVNNAGFSGHTSFGHQILLEDILLGLQPDLILLLAGANDRGLSNISIKDTYIFKPDRKSDQYSWKGKIYFFFADNSKILGALINLKRASAARNNVWNYQGFFDTDSIQTIAPTPLAVRDSILQKYEAVFISEYKQRISRLVHTCLQNGVKPVLLSQPILYDTLADPVTGLNLAAIEVPFKMAEATGIQVEAVDGLTEKAVLDLHNRAVREVAMEKGVPFIDLAAKMPKGFAWFYDPIHFTEEGCKEVARIVYEELEAQNLLP
ncbi:MAG: SGNH/GDSL hydrolase family protein [Saprospirales bacterium]|nr:SGNH/GDSL hydrolase family protein [Saprospirales bacterium]